MRSRVLGLIRRVGAALRRRRTAIGKTALVLALLALAALPAVVDNSLVGYLAVLMVVVSVALMFAYSLVLRRGVVFEERFDAASVMRGEGAEVVVKVTNNTFLLCPRVDAQLFISDLLGEVDSVSDERFTLLPRESRELVLSARFDHIGSYHVGLRSLRVYDLLGLFSHVRTVDSLHEVEVLPRVVDLHRIEVSEEETTDSTQFHKAIVADGFDYAGMRDYELGDSMKNIHWKASARFDTFLTRLRERQVNPSMCIVIDRFTQWPDGEQLMTMYDAVVESALSVAAHAHAHGVECVVAVPDAGGAIRAFGPSRTWEHREVIEALPRLEAADAPGATAQTVRELSAGLYASANIIVCTSNPDEQLFSEVAQARARRKNAVVLFARPSDLPREEDNAVKRRLASLGEAHVPYHCFEQVDELSECEL